MSKSREQEIKLLNKLQTKLEENVPLINNGQLNEIIKTYEISGTTKISKQLYFMALELRAARLNQKLYGY